MTVSLRALELFVTRKTNYLLNLVCIIIDDIIKFCLKLAFLRAFQIISIHDMGFPVLFRAVPSGSTKLVYTNSFAILIYYGNRGDSVRERMPAHNPNKQTILTKITFYRACSLQTSLTNHILSDYLWNGVCWKSRYFRQNLWLKINLPRKKKNFIPPCPPVPWTWRMTCVSPTPSL